MRIAICICLAICALLSSIAQARVIANIPNTTTPSPNYLKPIEVQSHKVTTKIVNGIAVTTLESVFYNPNSQVLEGTYLFALPKGASVSKFSLWIDGKKMPAELLDADKARKLYVDIVRRMVDPALLEFVGRETFKMRIFPLPARGTRKIELSYQQLLTSDGNLMRYDYPISTVGNGHEDIIRNLSWKIDIVSDIPIKSVFSPTHKVKIEKEDKKATVTFERSNVRADRDLVLYISSSNKKVDLSFIPFRKGEQGFFLMLLTPKTKVGPGDINPKDVVFIVDTSGSMVGDKMEQAKRALNYCVHQLNPGDRFNIIPFSTEASSYKDGLILASGNNIKAAIEYIEEDVYARGGTNIEEALGYAMDMAPKSGNRPYMVIFMTDGKPTIGVVDSDEILKTVKKASLKNLRLFTFGIGEGINTVLLDRLSDDNRGVREYVGSKEDIEIKVSSFVDKVSSPVLSNIKIKFPSAEGLKVSEVYPRQLPDLFKGSHITILGRYKGQGDQAIRVSGILAGKSREFVYEISFPKENTTNAHIPRLWAVRKVGFLIDQIRLHGENDELKKEVVRLAKKYGIVTPYTSYLVVEDTPTITRPGRSMPEPIDDVWKRDRRDAAIRPEEEAMTGGEYKEKTGKKAVKASKDLQELKNTEGVYEQDGKGNNEAQKKMVRKIDYKTFYKQGNIWCDSEIQDGKGKKPTKVRVRYMSDEYLELLKDNPEIGKFLAIGPRLTLLWKGKVYEIYQD